MISITRFCNEKRIMTDVANNESDYACVPKSYITETEEWNSKPAFSAPHLTEEIEGAVNEPSQWRVKDKLKTVSVALVICLNVDVDPPDVVKPSPCARMHCWVDPSGKQPTKAIEEIADRLHNQYARWQTKARYKTCLDPTVDDIKKLTSGLRRASKDDRVLFHYNGHGVPKPTKNGEIWVFNKNYTQYIPLSIVDLQMWVGAPSVYVYDCHNAGIILHKFEEFCERRLKERQTDSLEATSSTMVFSNGDFDSSLSTVADTVSSTEVRRENCIQLAACGPDEMLPLEPDLPADLFTACLTTPVRAALLFHYLQNRSSLPPTLEKDMLNKMPGGFAQRMSMVGELNWIFTAITDSIAWNVLPRELFTRLFRQDLLVASLFRNFLLAQRVLRVYGCTPVSVPELPDTSYHHMWAAWDHVCDLFLSQLPDVLAYVDRHRNLPNFKEASVSFLHSEFFAEQLQAFDVWLNGAHESTNQRSGAEGEQLPVVLQVLLSQQLRLRALELLSRFLDLGGWAVTQALQVGIFPYVLRLLQSMTKELRPLLVFVWCKILAFENSDCVVSDLVKDRSCIRYFINVLTDTDTLLCYKAMSAFVLSRLLDASPQAQTVALQENLLPSLLEVLDDPRLKPPDSPISSYTAEDGGSGDKPSYNTQCSGSGFSFHSRLISESDDAVRCRQFIFFCLGKLWRRQNEARWFGVRNNAHERLYAYLEDPSPEVRAAVVYALGSFVNNSERSDHANTVDLSVGLMIGRSVQDACPIVRRELVAAFAGLVQQFEPQFVAVGFKHMEEERQLQERGLPPQQLPPQLHQRRPSDSGSAEFVRSGSAAVSASRPMAGLHRVFTSPSDLQAVDINPMGSPVVRTPGQSMSTSAGGSSSSLPRINSASSLLGGAMVGGSGNSLDQIWRLIMTLGRDTHPGVAKSAKVVVSKIRQKIIQKVTLMEGGGRNTFPRSLQYGSSPNSSAEEAVRSAPNSPTTGRRGSPRASRIIRHGTEMPYSANHPTSSRKLFSDGGLVDRQHQSRSPSPSTSSVASAAGEHNLDTSVDSLPEVNTQLFEWCCRRFASPLTRLPLERDLNSVRSSAREYQCLKCHVARNNARQQLCVPAGAAAKSSAMTEMIFSVRTEHTPSIVRLHPFMPHLCVADRQGVSVYDTTQGMRLRYLSQLKPWTQNARLTCMLYLNEMEEPGLLLTGADDGTVRVWRNYYPYMGADPELATAFTGLSYQPSGQRFYLRGNPSGLVADWEPSTLRLALSGDVPFVRIWDVEAEKKLVDLSTQADTAVTSLSLKGNLLAAGCGDGWLRWLDVRVPCRDKPLAVLQGDRSHLVEVAAHEHGLVTVGKRGRVVLWDVRNPTSRDKPLQQFDVLGSSSGVSGGGGLLGSSDNSTESSGSPLSHTSSTASVADSVVAAAVHQLAPVVLTGHRTSREAVLRLHEIPTGNLCGTMTYCDPYRGTRLGKPLAAHFHPLRPVLAVAHDPDKVILYTTQKLATKAIQNANAAAAASAV